MYDDINEALETALNEDTQPPVNERKFQFILDYCLAERRGEGTSNLRYAHHQHDLIECASGLYDKALQAAQ